MDEEDNTPLCKIEIDEDDMERQSETGETVRKKSKATTSHCWRYFTKIRVGKDGKERAKCNGCNKIFVCGGRKYGTSHLNRHVMKCDKVKTEDIGQMMLDMQGKVEEKKIDQVVHRELLCELIVRHHLPYEFVEYPDLRDWISYLCPDAVMVSRNTIKADIERMYRKEKRMLKDLLVSAPSRICLTANLWTPINTKGFLSLTAHFVDLNWKLNSKLLNFCRMPFPYTGFELFKKVYELLQDWGIEKKIFSITLDNALANDVLQNTLRSQLLLQNGLICGGEFFHIRCCSHILNLIVQEGLSVLGNGLDQIRTSIKYIKGSETRMLKFKKCLQRFFSELDTSCGLCLDVPARWNSTYLMLKSALKYRHVFGSLHLVDESYKYCPSEEEWERVEKICRFLLPFYDITTLISVTSYPTSNLYFLQVWKIQCLLMENTKDEDEVIKNMAELMMVKFEKYWDEYSVVLAFGAILDPRMKLEILAFCFEKVDPLNWELNLGKIKEKLYKLFAEYNNKGLPTPSNVQRHKHGQSSSSSAFIPGLFDELKECKLQLSNKSERTQLDTYLDEPTLDFEFLEHMDVLEWWNNNSQRFPDLASMARDLLSIPIITAASESAFSIGSWIVNKYKDRLLYENVEAPMCTSSWKYGFVLEDDGEDINYQNGVDEGLFKISSNIIDMDMKDEE